MDKKLFSVKHTQKIYTELEKIIFPLYILEKRISEKMTERNKICTHHGKHRIVSSLLDDLLCHTPPGGKIPGIREIMRRSGCGRPVIQSELKLRIETGKIICRSRRGFFRGNGVKDSRKLILLHNTTYPSANISFTDILFDALRKFIEKEEFEFVTVNYRDEKPDFFLRLAKNSDSNKIILFGSNSKEMAEAAHQAFRFCMELLPRHDAVFGAEVRDSSEMTLIQLNYLFRLNYRRIGFFHHVEAEKSRTPVEFCRLFDYYRIMAEHGLKVNPAWVLFAPWEWKEFVHSMEKFFSSGDVPDAVIIPGSSLSFFYRFCKKRKIKIGSDIGVMGCDDYFSNLHPAITTTTNAPEIIAEEAWQVMKELLNGNILCRTTTLHVRSGASLCQRPVSHTVSGMISY